MALGALLVVEDECRLLKMLVSTLGKAGYWIVEASNGGRAMSALRYGSPSFAGLITDVNLGSGIDGWQLAREARTLCPSISVVYTSGTESHHWSYRGVPGSMMLVKPFTASKLLDAIGTLLETPNPARFANDLL